MTAPPAPRSPSATATASGRVELGRYTVPAGERVLYGQRVNGVVRVTDAPRGATAAPTSSSASSSRTGTPRCRRSSPITSSRRGATARSPCTFPSVATLHTSRTKR